MATSTIQVAVMEVPEDLLQQFRIAVENDDCSAVSELLAAHPVSGDKLDKGIFPWNMPPLAASRGTEMVDMLVKHGASVGKAGEWWGPGFGADQVKPEIAEYLAKLGAPLSIHAAVALGLRERVSAMLDADPKIVHARGGDGATPLHFCKDLAIARLLVENGADPDARDEDHDSTPAQWRIRDAEEFVRFLLDEGATGDIFMAAGLGDFDLTKRLVAEYPACTTQRIGYNDGSFPGIGFKDRGGTIYQWTLGFNQSPHEIAWKRGHRQLFDFLFDHTPARQQLLVACTLPNRQVAEEIGRKNPGLFAELDEDEGQVLAKYCWETNKDIEAVRLMLELGFPVDLPEHNHGFMALHNAAWCGDPELVKLLLNHGHPVDRRDPQFNSTAIGWAVHSCIEAKRHPDGKFPQVIKLLLESGTPFDPTLYPVGHQEIDAVLRNHLE